MVLGLKFMGKLIIFYKYLSVGQIKGPVWILGPQLLKRLITSSIYLSDEQNLKGVHLLGSPALSLLSEDVNSPNHKPMGKLIIFDKYLSVGQIKGPIWIFGPQLLKRLITSSIYLSNEKNLKGVRLLGSPALSLLSERCKLPGPQTYEEICIRGLTFFVIQSIKEKP